ncbi:hypothetical protein EHP00_1705 [Ecytonucleospora hepatopenaei]|uniref:Uncharacterized protein n=1 Tax=Ecytonucleospora hepatopenaei TaxID=646526 RepID=A0A1W0E2E2_9MICR|nr:hypothetical protein EHP00_1705 [Ecytonucleospora hepatopenaei]
MDTAPYSRNKNNFTFRCKTLWCIEYKKYVFIRINSVLDSYRTSLRSFLKICWKWFHNHIQKQIAAECGLNNPTFSDIVGF